jgi:hypothetical protein
MRDEIRKAREAQQAADESLFRAQNRLRAKQKQLSGLRRLGGAGVEQAEAVQRDIEAVEAAILRHRGTLQAANANLSRLVGEFVLPQAPQELASQLDDGLPCLLLPLRIETRFMGAPGARELWVRVYPDDVAVHTHEKSLTRDEVRAGIQYWTARAAAASIADAAERKREETGAWRALVGTAGGTRASWIASEIKRRALAKPENQDVAFLLIRSHIAAVLSDPSTPPSDARAQIETILASSHGLALAIRPAIRARLDADPQLSDATRQAIVGAMDEGVIDYLGFTRDELKPDTWSRAPRTEVLPERFVLIGETDGIRQEFPFPRTVPSPLMLGPNPQNLEAELVQRGGDLVVGEDFAWIWDFEQATKVGMAMRVPLPEPFARAGFDRLIVLGVRVSVPPADNRPLLEELIDNHHYSPGGMAFLPQGTATNHTADAPAGFSSDDSEGDASFDVEADEPSLEPTSVDIDKKDAQRLAEAWDVAFGKLASLRDAGREDVSLAKVMNQAMWPATLGFYLEEGLELDAAAIDRVRRFFTSDVVARGALPAIRIGRQPYGVLVTSALGRWQVDDAVDGEDAAFLRQSLDVMRRVETQWQQLVPQVSHVHAAGDSFAHLLNILGLHASSVDFARRVGTFRTVLWNLAHLRIGGNVSPTDPVARYFQEVSRRGIQVMGELGLTFPRLPRIFGLLFSEATSPLNGPLIDDVESAGEEKLSEELELPAKYSVTVGEGDEQASENRNYIGWLVASSLETLRQQRFQREDGLAAPVPGALLYRLLHRALLLSQFDATMKLYEERQLVGATVRREENFTNVEAGRTVTRWEFMGARINEVMPQVSRADLAVADFLTTDEGLSRPAAVLLKEVRDAIGRLEHLPTAALERLAAEHIDLCSYRLDAWQGALFARRLDRLNLLRGNVDTGGAKTGVHLGAYGWLEDVRPAPAATPAPIEDIPDELREDGVQVVEPANNGGFIHGPSINHAVAAAVLRNAYLTHASQQNARHFAVNLTSERVRTALSFLDGVRNGQELGALLGYQFERALHDRYVIDGQALAQFILAFRQRFPLVADRVTPDPAEESIVRKEAYQVMDGYALLEAVFLADPPLPYPYGVEGLPLDPADGARQAIVAEVDRLQDTLDAIADLSLAEGVFQATQGNYDRAGAMLKTLSEGNTPPEPEIVRTPRGGAVVSHRVMLHLDPDAGGVSWSVPATPRSLASPGLNDWLARRIGTEQSLQFIVSYDLDHTSLRLPVADLGLQPIDLVYLVGAEAGGVQGPQPVSSLTELEARIGHAYRARRKADDPAFDPSGRTTIEFMSRGGFPPGARSLFELLPLLRTLRTIVTTCRAVGAGDYVLASEENTDPASAGNVNRWDIAAMNARLTGASARLDEALTSLEAALSAVPAGALEEDPALVPDLGGVDYDGLRVALIRLANFGVPAAFPATAAFRALAPGASDAERLALLRARQSLIQQAFTAHARGLNRRLQAEALRTFSDLDQEKRDRLTADEKVAIFQQAAALLLGDAFRLIPSFELRNRAEIDSARAFAAAPQPLDSLLRFTHEKLAAAAPGSAIQDWRGLAVDEWMQGAAAVRRQVAWIDQVQTFGDGFEREPLTFEPLQLPFDPKAHWIALEYPPVSPDALDDPGVFVPAGDFLSIVRHVPAGHGSAGAQAGLVIDEWTEVIPNRVETTGIALHYDQPNTEPPQCLLLAVSPRMTGRWDWNDLVDTVIDTFDRAKRRAVEPDFLRTTPYAQLLPAVLSTFTSFPFATVSTNFAAQQASMVVEDR